MFLSSPEISSSIHCIAIILFGCWKSSIHTCTRWEIVPQLDQKAGPGKNIVNTKRE